MIWNDLSTIEELTTPTNSKYPISKIIEGYSTDADIEKRSPLFQIVRFVNSGKAQSAIESRGPSGRTPLLEAAANGHAEVVRLLVSKGANADCVSVSPEDREDTACHLAARRGHVDVVRVLLNKRPTLCQERNKLGQTPLHVACSKGYLPIVRLLLGRGACINERDAKGRTPLVLAQKAGKKNEAEAVVKLLEQKLKKKK